MLAQSETLPRKQRYTAHKIYETIVQEGYQGSESRVRNYISEWRKSHQVPKLFLPLDSVIVTTNLRFADWNPIFGDNIMTTALLDRLTSKGHIIEFIGESYRFRQRLKMEEQVASIQTG